MEEMQPVKEGPPLVMRTTRTSRGKKRRSVKSVKSFSGTFGAPGAAAANSIMRQVQHKTEPNAKEEEEKSRAVGQAMLMGALASKQIGQFATSIQTTTVASFLNLNRIPNGPDEKNIAQVLASSAVPAVAPMAPTPKEMDRPLELGHDMNLNLGSDHKSAPYQPPAAKPTPESVSVHESVPDHASHPFRAVTHLKNHSGQTAGVLHNAHILKAKKDYHRGDVLLADSNPWVVRAARIHSTTLTSVLMQRLDTSGSQGSHDEETRENTLADALTDYEVAKPSHQLVRDHAIIKALKCNKVPTQLMKEVVDEKKEMTALELLLQVNSFPVMCAHKLDIRYTVVPKVSEFFKLTHSCTPNCILRWTPSSSLKDFRTGVLELVALRVLSQDEALTINFSTEPRAGRPLQYQSQTWWKHRDYGQFDLNGACKTRMAFECSCADMCMMTVHRDDWINVRHADITSDMRLELLTFTMEVFEIAVAKLQKMSRAGMDPLQIFCNAALTKLPPIYHYPDNFVQLAPMIDIMSGNPTGQSTLNSTQALAQQFLSDTTRYWIKMRYLFWQCMIHLERLHPRFVRAWGIFYDHWYKSPQRRPNAELATMWFPRWFGMSRIQCVNQTDGEDVLRWLFEKTDLVEDDIILVVEDHLRTHCQDAFRTRRHWHVLRYTKLYNDLRRAGSMEDYTALLHEMQKMTVPDPVPLWTWNDNLILAPHIFYQVWCLAILPAICRDAHARAHPNGFDQPTCDPANNPCANVETYGGTTWNLYDQGVSAVLHQWIGLCEGMSVSLESYLFRNQMYNLKAMHDTYQRHPDNYTLVLFNDISRMDKEGGHRTLAVEDFIVRKSTQQLLRQQTERHLERELRAQLEKERDHQKDSKHSDANAGFTEIQSDAMTAMTALATRTANSLENKAFGAVAATGAAAAAAASAAAPSSTPSSEMQQILQAAIQRASRAAMATAATAATASADATPVVECKEPGPKRQRAELVKTKPAKHK